MATTCVRGDNNTACGRKAPRRIFYQQRTGRKGHGSNSSQSEGPINIAARHTDVRWIAMPGPDGTMKPTKPNSKRGQNQDRPKPPRHTNPLLHLLPTPESLPKTCSRISSVAVSPLIRTEHFPENCLQSCSAVKTSLRISTSRGPSCHLSGLGESARIGCFPAVVDDFTLPCTHCELFFLFQSTAPSQPFLDARCMPSRPPRSQATTHCTNSPPKSGSSTVSVSPAGAVKPAAPLSAAVSARQKILFHQHATGIFFTAGAIHWSRPSPVHLG